MLWRDTTVAVNDAIERVDVHDAFNEGINRSPDLYKHQGYV